MAPTKIELYRSDEVCMRRAIEGDVDGAVEIYSDEVDINLTLAGGHRDYPNQRANVWLTRDQAREIGEALTEAGKERQLFERTGFDNDRRYWSVRETRDGRINIVAPMRQTTSLAQELEQAIRACRASIAERE